MAELLAILSCNSFKIEIGSDIIYIQKQENILRTVLENKKNEENEIKERSHGPHVITNNRLRFCEAMMSDDVKTLYRKSQDLLIRSVLDSRNSVMRVVDLYNKVTNVFNDVSFIPETECLPDLHEDFAESKKIPLG